MHHTVQSSPFRSWGMSFKRFHLWKRPELNGKPIYNYSSWLDVQRHLNKHSFYIYQLNRCLDKDYKFLKRDAVGIWIWTPSESLASWVYKRKAASLQLMLLPFMCFEQVAVRHCRLNLIFCLSPRWQNVSLANSLFVTGDLLLANGLTNLLLNILKWCCCHFLHRKEE